MTGVVNGARVAGDDVAGAKAVAAVPLVVQHVAKSYEVDGRVVPVIGDLSLTLDHSQIVSIVGPSGCGKTTLLNTLCGLLTPDRGRISWYGREIAGQPQNVGYMLQKDLLLPWRTALGNVMLGLEIRGVAASEARDRGHAMLDQLGLHGFAAHYPSTLSGGMRQRVALARTLVNEPAVLLLDEPFAALDFQNKLLIESDTAKLVREGGRSLLLITHDIEEAVSLADRVIVLSKRPTQVKAVYNIALGIERTDMMAARDSRDFSKYVRQIWADLDVVLQ
ncbi:NitT/TauT family transport system ATP-binding protein [Bradyrhizobium lablabi]|uniref:NitT/TauT family transport system ATP-binding protein n=1 Tax=Bradyrhizobium lablabi TaxID=722472 RepID=A0A1M6MZR4_9BRAD|nr:ABC transporter ATP-binding protein [Bradyrhizobium lablabi]SHJ88904.1 NitT/TauT family transport system ATP-binding protein [Bradyrhizobium lablabi]